MEENTSTTDGNNPSDDSAAGTTTDADSTTSTDTNGTGENTNNSDPSKSTDDTAADGDKKPADGAEDTSTSQKIDEDIDDWAAKKGLAKAETDEQRAAQQALRDEQREFTRAQQAKREEADAKQLSTEVEKLKPEVKTEDDGDLDPLEKRLTEIEADREAERTTRKQSEFYISNKVSEEENKAILDIIKEKVAKPTTPEAKLTAFNLWSSPDALPDLLDLAKARLALGADTSKAESEAARQEREKIERESHANSPGRGATTHTDGKKTPEQERSERFDKWD